MKLHKQIDLTNKNKYLVNALKKAKADFFTDENKSPAQIKIKLILNEKITERNEIVINDEYSIFYNEIEMIFSIKTEKTSNKTDGFTISLADARYDKYDDYISNCSTIHKFTNYRRNIDFIEGFFEEACAMLARFLGYIVEIRN